MLYSYYTLHFNNLRKQSDLLHFYHTHSRRERNWLNAFEYVQFSQI